MIGWQQQYANTLTEIIECRCLCEKARVQSLVFNRSCTEIDLKVSECRENAERAKVCAHYVDLLINTNSKVFQLKTFSSGMLTILTVS